MFEEDSALTLKTESEEPQNSVTMIEHVDDEEHAEKVVRE